MTCSIVTPAGGGGAGSAPCNSDRVTLGDSAALKIVKQVRNSTIGGSFTANNKAGPGDVLEYRLLFSNPSIEPAFNVNVIDKTPPYTTLQSALPAITTTPSGMTCSIVTPAGGGGAGYVGSLQWSCSGTMGPGPQGEVRFLVRVDP